MGAVRRRCRPYGRRPGSPGRDGQAALIRLVRHPFVERDLIGIVEHIVSITEGDYAAAYRRLDEVDALLSSVLASPTSGVRLRGELDSWLVRHGDAGQRLTIVFKPDFGNECVYVAMVAFGGRDWLKAAVGRSGFGD